MDDEVIQWCEDELRLREMLYILRVDPHVVDMALRNGQTKIGRRSDEEAWRPRVRECNGKVGMPIYARAITIGDPFLSLKVPTRCPTGKEEKHGLSIPRG